MAKVFSISKPGFEATRVILPDGEWSNMVRTNLTTRVILPDSAWSMMVRTNLTAAGYAVQATDQDPNSCVRDQDELARMDALLDLGDPGNTCLQDV